MKRIIVMLGLLLFTNTCFGEVLVKQHEATYITVGEFINKTDGLTPMTSLSTPTGYLIHSDETETTLSSAGRTFTHIRNGIYKYEIKSGEPSILGDARISFSDITQYIGFSEFIRVVGTDTYILQTSGFTEGTITVMDVLRGISAWIFGDFAKTRTSDTVETHTYRDQADTKDVLSRAITKSTGESTTTVDLD